MPILKYLKDGEYKPLSNYTVQPITPVQVTGSSTTDIMSQNAVTVELNKKAAKTEVFTKTEANNTFLSKADASNNYLTKTEASTTYASETEVQNIVNQTVYGTANPSEMQQNASVVTTENLSTTLSGYQEKLTAGDNIAINGNTISASIPSQDLSGYVTNTELEGKNYATKGTTLAHYGITDAKIASGTITLGNQAITPLTSVPSEYVTETELAGKGYATTSALTSGLNGKSDTGHGHNAATASANGFLASTDKAWIDFMNGATTATSIANVPVSKHMCVATISANGSFTLASKPAAGREVHVIVKNSGSSEITVTMPTSGGYVIMGEESLKVAAGKYADINVLSDGTNMYVRSL